VTCKWEPKLIKALLALTPHVHVVLDQFDVDHRKPDWDLLRSAESVRTISSFSALEELATLAVDFMTRKVAVDRIISYGEFSQLGAGYLALLLGLRGADTRANVAVRDKRLMKQLVSQANVATTRYESLPDPADQEAVALVAKELSFPAVVKPAAGFGTMSTIRVTSPDDLADTAATFAYESVLNSRQLIVEEFVPGRELHVDALWSDGSPLMFAVSAYYQTRLEVNEGKQADVTGDPVDGSYLIRPDDAPELHRRLLELNRQVNDALDIGRAVTHMEVFERPDGQLIFSEIASRVGGGWIPAMLSQFLGQDVWTAVATALVEGRVDCPGPTARYLGAVHLQPGAPGVITSLPTEDQLRAMPGVLDWRILRSVGDKVSLNHPSEWCVFVILGADTLAEYQSLARQVIAELAVVTEYDQSIPSIRGIDK